MTMVAMMMILIVYAAAAAAIMMYTVGQKLLLSDIYKQVQQIAYWFSFCYKCE